MNLSNTVMERTLNRTEFRWKWLRFLRWTFGLGYAICLALLMVGAGVVWGVLTNRALVVACLGLIGVLGFLALLVLTIAVAAQSPDRNWLAGTVERIDNRLMDRLHALLFLERKSDAAAQGFATRIARQAHQLLLERPSRSPFSHRPILLALIVFALLLIGTVSFYSRFSPVQRLAAAERKALELEAALTAGEGLAG